MDSNPLAKYMSNKSASNPLAKYMQPDKETNTPESSVMDKAKNLYTTGFNIGMGAAGIAGAGYLGEQVLKKGGELFAHVGADLSRKTLDTVKTLGYGRIKAIGEKGGEYLAKEIIPQARRNVIKTITNLGGDAVNTLDNLGFKPDEVADIMSVSKGRMKTLGGQLSKNWTTLSQNLEKSTKEIGKKIGNAEKVAAEIGVDFSIPNTYGTMRRELRERGMVDLTGNLTTDAESIASPSLKQLAKEYEKINNTIKNKGRITVTGYRNLLTQLEASLGTDEKFNIPIYKTIRALRGEAVNAIHPSASMRGLDLKKLYREYSENMTLKNLGKRLNDVINEAPEKIEGTICKLKKEINSMSREKAVARYGKKFIEDIDAVSAAQELYPGKAGGIGRFVARGAVKGALNVQDKTRSAAGRMKSGIFKGVGKAILPIQVIQTILQAKDFSDDPEKALLNAVGLPTDNLAPKGSLERKIQLGKMT